MKTKIILLISIIVSVFFIKKNTKNEIEYPMPTTKIKWDMEEEGKSKSRKAWIERMHAAAPSVSWREVERNNTWQSYQSNQKYDSEVVEKSGVESFANGKLTGKWTERGSDNQAGSILEVAYHQLKNTIYALSAGGTIFKGIVSGNKWTVVNQDLRFSENYFDFITLPDGKERLLAAINYSPYYSDDYGETWQKANGINTSDGARAKSYQLVKHGSETYIIVLIRKSWYADIKLYYSKDFGESFKLGKTFATSNMPNVAAVSPYGSEEYYIIEQTDFDKSKIYKFRFDNQAVITVNRNSSLGFGDTHGNLQAYQDDDGLHMYAYNGDLMLKRSDDEGDTWQGIAELPIEPWSIGFYMSPTQHNILYTGGVNGYISFDSGENWELTNEWYEYYDEVETKLHADMMDIEEFTTKEGEVFLLNSNHGGLNISYDNGRTYQNIGLKDLNVSQYYDVATSPIDPNWVFAGAQDQGLQRSLMTNDEINSFEQVISGDYGHNTFTNNGLYMWTVYPGGWVSHYDDPYTADYTHSYTPTFNEKSAWIPPIEVNPKKDKSIILVGCSNSNDSESNLIELSIVNDELEVRDIPFDFGSEGQIATAISISPMNHDLWFVTTSSGQVYRSEDAGARFEKSFSGIPNGHYLYGADIYTSRLNENELIITGSGYSIDPVWVSYDKGEHFTSLSEGLPSTLVFGIDSNEDESILYAATEAGPFVFLKSEQSWFPLSGNSAPNQTYWSVEYVSAIKTARFGTYGRGIWDFKEEMISAVTNNTPKENSLTLLTNPIRDKLLFNMQSNKKEMANYAIVNMQGQVLKSGNILLDKQFEIDISGSSLPTSSYVIQFRAKGFSKSLVFVVVE